MARLLHLNAVERSGIASGPQCAATATGDHVAAIGHDDVAKHQKFNKQIPLVGLHSGGAVSQNLQHELVLRLVQSHFAPPKQAMR